MRDPYAVLGVKRDADASEIKSAWRALAKKIHPDQNRNDPNAAKTFAEAGAAYELLRDPQKRSRYDLLSRSGKQEATIQQQREAAREAAAKRKAAEENARKVMEELVKAEAEKARKAQAQADAAAKAQAQAQAQAQSQSQTQSKAQSEPSPDQPQGQAAGDGTATGRQDAGARSAGPESAEEVITRIFGAQPSGSEGGETRASDAETRSGSPSGSAGGGDGSAGNPIKLIGDFIRRLTGRAPQEKAPDQFVEARVTIEDLLKENFVTVPTLEGRDLRFRLEAGQTDGETIRLKGQGFKMPGMQRGDAVVTLRVEPSPLFSVSGHDIRTTLPIPLENAVLGCVCEAQSPTGPVEVTVPAWTGSDQSIRIPGLGLFDGKGGRGDLVVEIRIILWEKPDAKVTDLMRAMREGLYL